MGSSNGLVQVVVGACAEAAQHILRAAARGQDQHGHVLPASPQFCGDGKAVDARQHHVEHHKVVAARLLRQPLQGVLARFGQLDLVLVGLEVEAQPVSQVPFVFDDEDAAHDVDAIGSCTVNVLPRPGPSLSANTVPPWRATTARTMKSPSPAPLTRPVMTPGIR